MLLSSVLTIGFFVVNYQKVSSSQLVFDRVELINSSYVKNVYNISDFKINKFNRTTYVLNVDVEFLIDLDENIDIEVIFNYNRMKNNQYNRSPIRVPRDTICNVMGRFYDFLAAEVNKDNTNLPGPGSKFCPLKKVRICYDTNLNSGISGKLTLGKVNCLEKLTAIYLTLPAPKS